MWHDCIDQSEASTARHLTVLTNQKPALHVTWLHWPIRSQHYTSCDCIDQSEASIARHMTVLSNQKPALHITLQFLFPDTAGTPRLVRQRCPQQGSEESDMQVSFIKPTNDVDMRRTSATNYLDVCNNFKIMLHFKLISTHSKVFDIWSLPKNQAWRAVVAPLAAGQVSAEELFQVCVSGVVRLHVHLLHQQLLLRQRRVAQLQVQLPRHEAAGGEEPQSEHRHWQQEVVTDIRVKKIRVTNLSLTYWRLSCDNCFPVLEMLYKEFYIIIYSYLDI